MTDFIETSDIFSDATTVFRMSTGDTLAGSLDRLGDLDWVSISLEAGQNILITYTGVNESFGLVDPLLGLFGSDSVVIEFNDDGGVGVDSMITFEATATDTFFIQAGAFNDASAGAYTLTFDTLHETTDASDDAMTPFTIAPGETFNGTFESGSDLDRIAIEMVAGETYVATLEGFGNTNPGLRLFAPNGALLAQNDNFFGSFDSQISFTATASGTYYLQTMAVDNSSGAYQLHVGSSTVEGQDAPTSTATPYSIDQGGRFSGTFETQQDRDIIATEVTEGQTYVITTTGTDDAGNGQFVDFDVLDQNSNGMVFHTDFFGDTGLGVYTSITTGPAFLLTESFTGAATNYEVATMAVTPGAAATAGDDIRVGLSTADSINLGNGDDYFAGFGGNDTIVGGEGNDMMSGGVGFDVIRAGNGNDSLNGGANADNLLGQGGDDLLVGEAGFDRLFGGTGNDFLDGGDGSDGMFGQQGNDTLIGGNDNDRMNGGPGNDSIDGGAGNDQLFGGAGFDTIVGGAGDDVMAGNFNADLFVFSDINEFGNDTITDFAAENQFERIDLRDVLAITSFEDLMMNHLGLNGDDLVINVSDGSSITLQNLNVEELDASDFLFTF